MKKFSIEIKWGFIFTIAIVAWSIVEKETGLYSTQIAHYFWYSMSFAPFALFIYITCFREKKLSYFNGNMTWRQGFFSGLILTVVIALLVPAQKNIVFRFIAPEFFENAIAYNLKSGMRTREELEKYFNLTSSIYDGMSLALSLGTVTSAALAFIFKSKEK